MRTTRLAAGPLLLGALALTGCVGAGGDPGTGYVAGDGTVTEWSVADRGDPVDLVGTSFSGEAIDLADFRGQVVLVNTWYAACPPCRAEAPDLVAADGREDVQVVGLNSRDDAGAALAFDRTFGVAYPSIADIDGAATAALQGLVALNAVPTTLVLDPEGRVASRVVGRADPSTLEALIESAKAGA